TQGVECRQHGQVCQLEQQHPSDLRFPSTHERKTRREQKPGIKSEPNPGEARHVLPRYYRHDVVEQREHIKEEAHAQHEARRHAVVLVREKPGAYAVAYDDRESAAEFRVEPTFVFDWHKAMSASGGRTT